MSFIAGDIVRIGVDADRPEVHAVVRVTQEQADYMREKTRSGEKVHVEVSLSVSPARGSEGTS